MDAGRAGVAPGGTEMPAGTCLAPSPGAEGGGIFKVDRGIWVSKGIFWGLWGYFGVYRGILGCITRQGAGSLQRGILGWTRLFWCLKGYYRVYRTILLCMEVF